jgi:hypothetical protein
MDFVAAGRAFLLSWEPQEKRHLWLVLTDPDGNPPRVVAVMVRSRRHFTDDTVILDAGDHPFIKHPSSVHYSSAALFRVEQITRAAKRNHCHLQPDMSKALLMKVRAGLLTSTFTVKTISAYCRTRFPVT